MKYPDSELFNRYNGEPETNWQIPAWQLGDDGLPIYNPETGEWID